MSLQEYLKKDMDYNFILMVSDKCNLRCRYCFDSSQQMERKACLTKHKARKSIEWILSQMHVLKLPAADVVFFGGEPLLNFSVIRFIVNYVFKKSKEDYKKIRFAMVSNGTLLNEGISRFLIKHNINCSLSLDGSKFSHNKNRVYSNGRGSFDSIWRKRDLIKNMIKEKIISNALITITPKTASKLFQNIKFLVEKKMSAIAINFDWTQNADWNEASLASLRNQLQLVTNIIEESVFSKKRLLLIKPIVSMIRYLILTESSEIKKEFAQDTRCGLGKYRIVIDTNGNLYPCTKIYYNSRLKEIFNLGTIDHGVRNKNILYWLRNIKPCVDTRFSCHKCDLKIICQTHCPSASILHGDLYRPPLAMCKISRIMYNAVKPLYCKIKECPEIKRIFFNNI